MRLEKVSLTPPEGLRDLLDDLGAGQNGFRGTDVPSGAMSLQEYLRACCDMAEGRNLKPGLVPQTVFWVLDADNVVIGMVKVRHYLNDTLRINGGHIGYFIRSDGRGKGLGKRALALALTELKALGEPRALITIHSDNIPSIKVVEANGGQPGGTSIDPETGAEIKKFWIELEA